MVSITAICTRQCCRHCNNRDHPTANCEEWVRRPPSLASGTNTADDKATLCERKKRNHDQWKLLEDNAGHLSSCVERKIHWLICGGCARELTEGEGAGDKARHDLY